MIVFENGRGGVQSDHTPMDAMVNVAMSHFIDLGLTDNLGHVARSCPLLPALARSCPLLPALARSSPLLPALMLAEHGPRAEF